MFPRRELLRAGLIGLGSPLLAPWGAAASAAPGGVAAKAKSCILLCMDGGPPHLDLWDLKPDAPAEVRGPFRPIATSVPDVQISELLPRTAQQMHHVLLVRSLSHRELVHPPALYQMLTGRSHDLSLSVQRAGDSEFPHIGASVAAHDAGTPVMPKFIRLPETMHMDGRAMAGQTAGFLGPAHDPLPVDVSADCHVQKPALSLAEETSTARLTGRRQLLARLEKGLDGLQSDQATERYAEYQRQALDVLGSPQVATAFDVERESAAMRDRYGRHRHGQSVLVARRLVEAGAKFVTVYWGRERQDWADGVKDRIANNPWDGHRNHFPLTRESLAPRADQALAALVSDLAERGRLDETLVVWMGDFGRTPKITKPWASRDHWPYAFSIVLAGGGTRGGTVFGRTDRLGAEVTDSPVTPADLTATISYALGVDPQTTMAGPQGVPYAISTGRPRTEWFR